MSARNDVLEWGLLDWVALDRIHDYVVEENPHAPVAVVQKQVLGLIDELVSEGLFVIGDRSGERTRFVPWTLPLPEALERIRSAYTDNFDDKGLWAWYAWLDLTDKGKPIAEAIQRKRLADEDAEASSGARLDES